MNQLFNISRKRLSYLIKFLFASSKNSFLCLLLNCNKEKLLHNVYKKMFAELMESLFILCPSVLYIFLNKYWYVFLLRSKASYIRWQLKKVSQENILSFSISRKGLIKFDIMRSLMVLLLFNLRFLFLFWKESGVPY